MNNNASGEALVYIREMDRLSSSAGILMFVIFSLLFPLQAQHFNFRHLTVEDGLSQNTINCIYQDSRGFLWLGTQDGLNLYNGYEIHVIGNDPENVNSLSHNWIWDVIEDPSGKIWIATWKGLNFYDPETGIFKTYLPDEDKASGISGDRPVSLTIDHEGYLWIGTWGGGLNRYDLLKDEFTHFSESENSDHKPGLLVRKIFCDKKGNIWVGTWNGLFKIRKNSVYGYNFIKYLHTEDDPNSLCSNKITSICEDEKGNIWIGTLGGGVSRLSPSNNSFTDYRNIPEDSTSLSSNDISCLCADRRGNIWIGTVSDGINQKRKGSNSFIRINENSNQIESIGSDNIYSIYEEKSGLILAGAGGLNIYDYKTERFSPEVQNLWEMNLLENHHVTALYEDDEGFIWAGTENRGIKCISPENLEIVKEYFTGADKPGNRINCDNISGITSGKRGNIWISTRGGGLIKINNKNISQVFDESSVDKPVAGLNYLNGLCIDSSGMIWLASYDRGLISFDPEKISFRSFTEISNPVKLSSNYLLRNYTDSENEIWICTWGGGLCRFNPENKNLSCYTHQITDSTSIPGNIVHSLYEYTSDSGRIIWVGTENGLSFFMPDEEEVLFRTINFNNDIAGRPVYGILMDRLNRLWFSTNSGLYRYSLKNPVLKRYAKADGLQGTEFNAGAFLELRDGSFIFGGINGINVFRPENISDSNYNPLLAITAFKVFNEEYDENRFCYNNSSIVLPHSANFFSFEFASLDYSNPEKNQYHFKLEGIDPDWINAENRRYANYTRIKPGEYLFRVKGTNSDGIQSIHEGNMKIIITPPFWQTWWFRAVLILFVTGILYFLHRYRINQVKEIEGLRVRIASDLHDEIGSALTRITIHSQKLSISNNRDEQQKSLKAIGDISRKVISTMSDVVWSIDARNDSLKDLTERMQDFAYSCFSSKDIKFLFKLDGLDKNRNIPVNFRQNVFFIFKEAINNIIKHADADEVIIELRKNGKEFFFKIKDNGKGFDPIKIKRGNGLRNMHMRASKINGNLEIIPDNGTLIKFNCLLK